MKSVVTARKSLIAAAALALSTALFCSQQSHADDMKMEAKAPMPAEDQAAVTMQIDRMKKVAADPSDAKKMTADLARIMVMQHIVMQIVMDPQFKQMTMDTMADPAIKKVHDDAVAMDKNPGIMKKFQDEILADPKEVKAIVHQAMMITMMHDRMEKSGTEDKKDSMSDLKDKMMDKVNSKIGN